MRGVRGKGHKFGQACLSMLCISGDGHIDGWTGSAQLTAGPSGRVARVLSPPPIPLVWDQGRPLLLPPPPVQFPEVDTRWRCEDREGEKPVPSHEEEDAADGQIG